MRTLTSPQRAHAGVGRETATTAIDDRGDFDWADGASLSANGRSYHHMEIHTGRGYGTLSTYVAEVMLVASADERYASVSVTRPMRATLYAEVRTSDDPRELLRQAKATARELATR